ncbi:MAG: DUF1565 domain-containing protein [Chloroflexota bacterium]
MTHKPPPLFLLLCLTLIAGLACAQLAGPQPSSAHSDEGSHTYLPLTARGVQAPTPTATLPGPTSTPPGPTNTPAPTSPATQPAPAHTYYVATGGSDQNPGTFEKPWRTIQKAADTVGPDSLVYVRGGIYRERIILNVSGSTGKYITFQSYPGETAVIDADGLAFSEAEPALWFIYDQSYVIVKGFELRNYRTSTSGQVPFGIAIFGASHHIELRNNLIHHIEHNGSDPDNTDAHGIAVYGESGTQAVHDIVIDGNELRNLKLGSSEALAINGNVQAWQVTNNLVHDSNNIGIVAIGFENTAPANDWARDGLIANNQVYNIDSNGNVAYGDSRSADCIYVDGARQITIERNLAHHCNIGIEVASEHEGGYAGQIVVRNNFVHSNTDVGISIGGYAANMGGAYDCTIVNNTFYNNTTHAEAWGSELYIQDDTQNLVIENNIFFADGDGSLLQSWSDVMGGNRVDYNLFFVLDNAAGSWEWRGNWYETFAEYQAQTGNDSHSLAGQDPRLVSTAAPDLHLQSDSPAIERGTGSDAAGPVDFDGQPRRQNTIEIGADEVR